mgnify:CR=1 FL=1
MSRLPFEDTFGAKPQLAYVCPCNPDRTILVYADWDQSLLRCPYCTELLVEPCIPDLARRFR